MDPKVAEEALRFMLDSLKEGKDFVVEQLPLVVQELIVWQRVWHCVALVLWLLAIAGFYRIGRLCWSKRGEWEDEIAMPGVIISWILAALGLIPLILTLHTTLQLFFAPRVYLLEYLRDLVSGHK